MTFNFIADLLDKAGVRIESVAVSALEKDTFYATAHAQRGEESFTVDARPSDAIALALRTQSPIFAAPEVMEAVGLDIPADMEVVSPEEQREENHSKLLAHLTEAGCLRQRAEMADE